MKDYDNKKMYLYLKQKGKCPSCGEELEHSQKTELAHHLINSKSNKKLYGEIMINHKINLSLTHSGACNSKCIINTATKPIKAQERLIDIMSSILLDDPLECDYHNLLGHWENVGKCITVDPVYVGQYEIIENFFAHFKAL